MVFFCQKESFSLSLAEGTNVSPLTYTCGCRQAHAGLQALKQSLFTSTHYTLPSPMPVSWPFSLAIPPALCYPKLLWILTLFTSKVASPCSPSLSSHLLQTALITSSLLSLSALDSSRWLWVFSLSFLPPSSPLSNHGLPISGVFFTVPLTYNTKQPKGCPVDWF